MRRLISAISLIAALPLSAQTYSITHNYNVGGEGGWDYVIPDAPNHRLFIARSPAAATLSQNKMSSAVSRSISISDQR